MMKLEASARLQASTAVVAAEANDKKAKKYLTSCGFEGLELKSSRDNIITFSYTKYDKRKVAKMLGQPKENKSESIRYAIPGQGVIAIWPSKMQVVMKNSARN